MLSISEQLGYAVLSEDTDEGQVFFGKLGHECKGKKSQWHRLGIPAIAFILGALLLETFHYTTRSSTKDALRKTNTYTPFLDKLPLDLHTTTVNGSLFNDPFTIFKAPPSEVADQAWEAITDVAVFPISEGEVRKLGKDPEYSVRVPQTWGYGSDAYLAQLDSQHLLHCLNVIRKFAYYSHYYLPMYGPNEENIPPLQTAHRAHCIHVLMEHLTCQPSLNLITFNWMQTQNSPFPDFNIERKCVNWGAVQEWVEDSRIQGYALDEEKRIRKPEGASEIAAPKELLDLQ